VSWTSDDAIDRARDELARRAETLHPGWSFTHGLFGWTAKRQGQTLTAANMPGLLAQVASADRSRKRESPGRGAPKRSPGAGKSNARAGAVPLIPP